MVALSKGRLKSPGPCGSDCPPLRRDTGKLELRANHLGGLVPPPAVVLVHRLRGKGAVRELRRRLVAGTLRSPQTLWVSRTGSPLVGQLRRPGPVGPNGHRPPLRPPPCGSRNAPRSARGARRTRGRCRRTGGPAPRRRRRHDRARRRSPPARAATARPPARLGPRSRPTPRARCRAAALCPCAWRRPVRAALGPGGGLIGPPTEVFSAGDVIGHVLVPPGHSGFRAALLDGAPPWRLGADLHRSS